MSRSVMMGTRRLQVIVCLALALTSATSVGQAQDIDIISCDQIRPYYQQRISELWKQSSFCINRMLDDRRYGAPYITIGHGACYYSHFRDCAAPMTQCPALVAQRDRALAQCRHREEEARLERERKERERRQAEQDANRRPHAVASGGSLSSSVGVRTVMAQSGKDIGYSYAKKIGGPLMGRDGPIPFFQDIHRQNVGKFLRSALQVEKNRDTVTLAMSLAKAVSGGSKEERGQGVLWLLHNLSNRTVSEMNSVSRMNNPAAHIFASFSFLILKNMQVAVLNDLNDVATKIALFGANEGMTRVHQDIWYSMARAEWSRSLATNAGSSANRDIDMSTTELVNDFRAKAQQIAHANARALDAQREARLRAEREAQEAADLRAAAYRAAMEAERQRIEQQIWEAEQTAQRIRNQQSRDSFLQGLTLGGIALGVAAGIGGAARPSPPVYVPPRMNYPPPPPPRAPGGRDPRCERMIAAGGTAAC